VSFTLDRYGHLTPMADVVPLRRDHQGDLGGASKNRTCDLSIISAAL
jgi:hypothetical protein